MGNTYYKPEPAIEAWALMRENTHKTFRFNRRTISWSIFFGAVVPSFVYWLSVRDFRLAEDRQRRAKSEFFLTKN